MSRKIDFIGLSIGNAGLLDGCEDAPSIIIDSLKEDSDNADIYKYKGPRNDINQMADFFSLCATKISKVLENECFPMVIGGDHSCAIATWSGVSEYLAKDSDELALIWVDAHLDSHTPESSLTGNVHGMPVSHLLGSGNDKLTKILSDNPKIKPENIVFFGIRSYEDAEREFLENLGVKVYYQKQLGNADFKQTFLDEYERLAKVSNNNVGISFDLDALDPVQMRAVGTPVKHGIDCEIFFETLLALDYSKLVCFEVAEYNPRLDRDDVSLEYMLKVLRLVKQNISLD